MEHYIYSCIHDADAYFLLLQVTDTIKKLQTNKKEPYNIILHYNKNVNTNNTSAKNILNIVFTAESNDVAKDIRNNVIHALDKVYTAHRIHYHISERKLYTNTLYTGGLYDYKLIEKLQNTYTDTYIIYKHEYDMYVYRYAENGDVQEVEIV